MIGRTSPQPGGRAVPGWSNGANITTGDLLKIRCDVSVQLGTVHQLVMHPEKIGGEIIAHLDGKVLKNNF